MTVQVTVTGSNRNNEHNGTIKPISAHVIPNLKLQKSHNRTYPELSTYVPKSPARKSSRGS